MRYTVLAAIFLLVFTSCDRYAPSGFWRGYKPGLVVTNISDQGPYGGTRAIYWKSGVPGTFTAADVLGFAQKHGWQFVHTGVFDASHWVLDGNPVFPLSETGFSPTMSYGAPFPRWFGGKTTIFIFRTGWLIVRAGTDETVEDNGAVMIDSSGQQMAIYHLWGG